MAIELSIRSTFKLFPSIISLFMWMVYIPSKTLHQISMTQSNNIYMPFIRYSQASIHFHNISTGINRNNYAQGNFLTAFDHTPKITVYFGSYWNLVRSSSIIR